MELQDLINNILAYAQNEPKNFWIIVGVIVLLILFLKPKNNSGTSLPGGMNPLQWEVFKRR